MKIIYGKKFLKKFKKLKKGEQKRVYNTIKLFKNNIFDPQIHNHALKGDFLGYRSLNVGGDLRIIFSEENEYVTILFLEIGTHSFLY